MDGQRSSAPTPIDGRTDESCADPVFAREYVAEWVESPGQAGPGVARVAAGAERVRLEVDGRELVATDVTPGEPVEDVEARLKLAVGQRGGIR